MDIESNQMSGQKGKNAGLPIIISIIAILLIVFFIFTQFRQKEAPQESYEITKEKVTVKKIEASSAQNEAPSGLPQDTPIEWLSVLESNTANYEDRGLVQYSVVYWTEKTLLEVYREYENFMLQNGYDFGTNGKSVESNSLYAIKGNSDLAMTASIMNGRTTVVVVFVERI